MDNDRNPTIAIVGAAGIFPGARDLAQFWRNIVDGKDAIAPVPPERWPVPREQTYAATARPDKARSLNAGLIRDFRFDPTGFAMGEETTAGMDPVHHLVLETGRRAWLDCRHDPIDPNRVAVILAAIALPTEAASRLTRKVFLGALEHKLFKPQTETGLSRLNFKEAMSAGVTSFPAALLGAALNLGGGTLTLDAACASSLFAVKLACDALQAGRADAVLAGGVARPDTLYTQIGFTQLQALSLSGRCAPFDRTADGLVVGEGCGIVVLKRLEDALRQGDAIQAVIRSTGLSNDMRGNLLAPDTEGQMRAMQAAYDAAGWKPRDVDLIECHGAATPVGDATELRSLRTLWGEDGWQTGQCAIGSIKSMIGHLLTAAGAAGLIKVLLGLRHEILPPSLNFSQAAPGSPLHGSPFRVQTEAAPWPLRDAATPRRAAVSAFGFGGINAHLLLEEWPSLSATSPAPDRRPVAVRSTVEIEPIAVVGMEAFFGPSQGLDAFKEMVFKGLPAFEPLSDRRLKNCRHLLDLCRRKTEPLRGALLDEFEIDLSDFRIPPKEIPDILPQHLLMLKTARTAMVDAGLPLTLERPRMGCIVGMAFDLENTNFHLRWGMRQVAEAWSVRYELALTPDQIDAWAGTLADACAAPLTHTRTLGALGGLIASRIAREFRFGGPSFTVSADAASGLNALAAAAGMLRNGEVDGMLVGAVDLPGDLRRILISDCLQPFADQTSPHSLDRDADGTLPGEGAAALVLKRLADARRDGNRIYALVRGFGTARGGTPFQQDNLSQVLARALAASLTGSGVPSQTIGYVETHGSGNPAEDGAEYRALQEIFAVQESPRPALGALKACCGHAGAAAGLAGFVKTALCLYHQVLPPLPSYRRPPAASGSGPFFHVPQQPVLWPSDRADHPRRACLNALTAEGNAMSVVLEEAPVESSGPGAPLRFQAMTPDHGLFVLREAAPTAGNPPPARPARPMAIICGGMPLDPPRPPESPDLVGKDPAPHRASRPAGTPGHDPGLPLPPSMGEPAAAGTLFFDQAGSLIRHMTDHLASTSTAHQSFLALTEDIGRQYARAVDLQADLMLQAGRAGLLAADPAATTRSALSPSGDQGAAALPSPGPAPVAFDREMCMEFAVGSVARVLGPAFAAVDRYPARVRLPDAPLMLVDRILSVKGRKGVLGPGRLVTEHDVRPDAWYLDGGRAPVCISVEAGQADLFLCAYLGIDLEVKGERTYRLLDATVTFHRGLPRPGEVIRYDIEIEKFIRQGPTWLFFFRFEGTIDGQPLISMRNGCAGFFTEEEVRRSGGILLTGDDLRLQPGIAPEDWQPLVPMGKASFDSAGLAALRRGDLSACFGAHFEGIQLPEAQRLPGGRMALIDRVLDLDPTGGRYGLGLIRAEADIHPDDWFLTCHFVDDMVMPGTLMYECCAHTLRVFLQRMGWISERPEVVFEPVIGRHAVLKCRGPVTPATRHVVYEVELREVGFDPEPYVAADAHMYADGHRIVLFRDMTMKMTGTDRAGLEAFWAARRNRDALSDPEFPVFSRERLLEFATGLPSRAFGPPYQAFDRKRFIARLPGPPYAFIHRVTRAAPPPWILAPDGWVEAEYDSDPRDWYFRSNGASFMPICILMEIALQACGFLAAYMGSALRSEKDLHFRNLDGEATLQRNVPPDGGPLQARARLLQFSGAGDMLIEHYAFEVDQSGRRIYEGRTSFGFFTEEALARQVGLAEGDLPAVNPSPSTGPSVVLEDTAPLTPDDGVSRPAGEGPMPSRALRMIDRIEQFDPQGGPAGLGYILGSKTVDPDEWFFKAHFLQDPVCPGSLGIESLVQLLRFAAGALWPDQIGTHAMALLTDEPHVWRYRGQILPSHARVEVEAVITARRDLPHPCLKADGYLKCDGLYIYKMQNFGLCLTPRDT